MPQGGLRKVEDEKQLLSELSKLFHVAKASQREQRQVKQAQTQARKSSTHTPRRGSARRSTSGGSVWIVLKGGFSARSVPTSVSGKTVEHKASVRGSRSEKRRLAALETAEEYVRSAWQQAAEAGLLLGDGKTPTEEGEQYLREQYGEARKLLRKEPVGYYLKQLVETHCHGRSAPAVLAGYTRPADGVYDSEMWGDILTREMSIQRPFEDCQDGAMEALQDATSAASAASYFPVAEPCREIGTDSTASNERPDIVPTKCIVRIRDSQRHKHTAILSTAKSINHFRSNFMQVLRKELASSKLPRGPPEGEADGASDAKHQQRTHAGGGTPASKRHKRRR